jgi:hypothetical protein
MDEEMGLKIIVSMPCSPCLPNFMKIYQLVQKLLGGGAQKDRQTHTQSDDLISLLSFLESRMNDFNSLPVLL